jgi:hypothetical protein
MFDSLIVIIGYLVIAIIVIEGISFIVLRYLLSHPSTKELRKGIFMNPLFKESDSYGADDKWFQQYYDELEDMFKTSGQAANKWQPLGMWSAPRYHGKSINVDKYNLRRTVISNKQNTHEPKLRIHFFGASHVWGWGVRDQGTIPSLMSTLTNNVMIENHAQLGYVSSQSVIALIQRLKYDPKPDIVIFIDGLNDVYSAYQSGISGIEQNALSRKERFESKPCESAWEHYINNSNLIKLANSVSKLKGQYIHKKDNDHLAYSIIRAYNQNVSLVNKIATSYGFKVFFIWQPTIFDKPHLTEYELKLLDIVNFCNPLYNSINKIIQTQNILGSEVTNLSNLFDENKEPIFVDPWHYNEHANTIIAKKINNLIESA